MTSLSIFGGETVRFPPEVISADHGERLVAEAQGRIDPTLLTGKATKWTERATLNRTRVERLTEVARQVVQPQLPRFPGPRGAAAIRTKKILIRLLYWYVEPRWDAQSVFNRECAESARELSDDLDAMRKDLRRAQLSNRALREEVEALRLMVDQVGLFEKATEHQ